MRDLTTVAAALLLIAFGVAPRALAKDNYPGDGLDPT